MLTADQIQAIRDKAGRLMDPVVEFLIEDIAKRVAEAGQLTSTAAYQVWRAQQLGLSQRKLKKELRKRLKVSHWELRKLLTQAAEVGYNFDISRFPFVQAVSFDENGALQQIVKSAVELAQDDLTNITQTIGFVTPTGEAVGLTDAYQQTCDYAFQKVSGGGQDHISAVREAIRNLAEKGIRTIDYESGVHTSLEAAVRRNMMGVLGLMDEKINQQNHDDLGCDGWEISAHHGSAPDHEPFQGKQYPDAEYKRLNSSLHRRIGTLGCGHSAMGIIFGVNDPQYTAEELEEMRRENEEGITYEGKHFTLYKATQRQRSIERAMRKQKHRILIDEKLGDTEKLQWDQIRYVRQREEYKRFSEAAGLRMQRERAEVFGFGPKQDLSASKAARSIVEFDEEFLAKDISELLPKFNLAEIPDAKITGYALNMEHPVGKHKAIAFQKILGYTIDNKDELLSQVRSNLGRYRASERKATKYGRPFEVKMLIHGANGKIAPVKTAWQIDHGSEIPRLVSIYID